ncbi:amino acid/polyamine/organocation transporter, APC superfamily [Burkholderia sp. GAS332]|nr:amino acid/polyamine/organocation transporter, APC superfamily [Burkholderia sp. GAS332]
MAPVANSGPKLRKEALGLFSIVSAVIATNGPLTTLVGGVPIALAMGNGPGLPAVFLIVGWAYILFSIGFTAMSRYTTNAGAFYAYIAKGLGRPWGVGAAFVAIVSYNSMQLACYGMLGYFMGAGLHEWFGVSVSWWVCCLIVLGIIFVASISNIQISGRLLLCLLACELLIIVVFDVAGLLHGGPDGYTLASFTPHVVFTPRFGTSVLFVVASYMGFETTAIYAEEAKDPRRNVPRATFIAIITIMLVYTLSVWVLVVLWGPNNVAAQAGNNPIVLWYGMADLVAGRFISKAMSVLMLTSLFAAQLSFHNTTSRYIFALGREHVLPQALAWVHPTQQTPVAACTVQAAAVAIALVMFAKVGADPMNVVLPYTAAFSTIGLLGVQCLTSIAVAAFFLREVHSENIWVRAVSPILSLGALGWFLSMEVTHLPLLTGSNSRWIFWFPYSIAALALFGVCYALWLRAARPDRYRGLGRFLYEA